MPSLYSESAMLLSCTRIRGDASLNARAFQPIEVYEIIVRLDKSNNVNPKGSNLLPNFFSNEKENEANKTEESEKKATEKEKASKSITHKKSMKFASQSKNSITIQPNEIFKPKLKVHECIKIMPGGIIINILNPAESLSGLLFELNHVRVNPATDNTEILSELLENFEAISVRVNSAKGKTAQPKKLESLNDLSEINDTVRLEIDSKGLLKFFNTNNFCPKVILGNPKANKKHR